mmetsp:Transcript_14440/g.36906  ORF Transcript_14440/g.36906 Transcript_14440/m.36906 type:complete len:261 (-) Transcript_14440:234-1016(-)
MLSSQPRTSPHPACWQSPTSPSAPPHLTPLSHILSCVLPTPKGPAYRVPPLLYPMALHTVAALFSLKPLSHTVPHSPAKKVSRRQPLRLQCRRRIVSVAAAGQSYPEASHSSVGPSSPSTPATPLTPGSPSPPAGPGMPASPLGPPLPGLPVGPAGPDTPTGPRGPAGPGRPWTPLAPFFPFLPSSPGGPCGPTVSGTSLMRLDSLALTLLTSTATSLTLSVINWRTSLARASIFLSSLSAFLSVFFSLSYSFSLFSSCL